MQFISADNEGVLDMLTKKDPVFEKAVKKLVYVSADEQLRYELDMREKAELDYWSAMKTNYDKGMQEGKLEAAKAMLVDGELPEKISKWLQIPLAEILKIKNSL